MMLPWIHPGSHPKRHLDRFSCFGATVCKTVHPILSDRCLSVCLSVTLVYCRQTIECIRIPLGMEVGLGLNHIMLDGNPTPPPPKKRHSTRTFWPTSIVAKLLDGSRCHLVRRYRPRLRPHCVRWVHRSPTERGTAATPSFRSMSIVATRSPIPATAELLFAQVTTESPYTLQWAAPSPIKMLFRMGDLDYSRLIHASLRPPESIT